MKEYAFYLFDADGTILDTRSLICASFAHTLKSFGTHPIPEETIIEDIGLPLRYQLRKYIGELNEEELERITDFHVTYQSQIYQEHLKLFPGVAEALECLCKRGKCCAVVTSRSRASLEQYLRVKGIRQYFHSCICIEDTKRPKPHPEPVFKALAALEGSPQESLFIGDTSFDVEAGKRAGLDTVLVSWSSAKRDEFFYEPDYVISDMRELCIA